MKFPSNFIIILLSIFSCGTSQTEFNESLNISDEEKAVFESKDDKPVKISNDNVEYEITIIDFGFNTWLNSIAKPRGFYSNQYLRNRNNIYVINWNQRVLQPRRYDSNLYEMQINYSSSIDYGYEVNYQLYNYFIYFQRKYNQRLGPFFPSIN